MTKTRVNFSRILVSVAICMALFGAMVLFAACDDSTSTEGINGTYTCESANVQATELQDWMKPAAEASVLTLNADLTGTFSFNGEDATFWYNRVGNNISVHIVFGGEPKRIWYGVLDGNRLTMEVRFNAYFMIEIVYKKA